MMADSCRKEKTYYLCNGQSSYRAVFSISLSTAALHLELEARFTPELVARAMMQSTRSQ